MKTDDLLILLAAMKPEPTPVEDYLLVLVTVIAGILAFAGVI